MSLSRALAVWLLMMLAETIHGILRTLYLAPIVGDFRARQICTFTGAAILLSIAVYFHRWLGATTQAAQIKTGALWLTLTVIFELTLGHYVAGLSWHQVTADFRIWEGGLLPLGLVILLLAPLLASRFQSFLHK